MSETIAYFSMEIGLDNAMPTYSGGLGILAGDTLRAAADLHVPIIAVTLLHRQGYFCQKLDDRGNQTESPVSWNIADNLELLHRHRKSIRPYRTFGRCCKRGADQPRSVPSKCRSASSMCN